MSKKVTHIPYSKTETRSIYDTSNSSKKPDRALTLCKSILEHLTFENYESHQERWVHSGTFNTEAGAKAVAHLICTRAQEHWLINGKLYAQLSQYTIEIHPFFQPYLIKQCQDEFNSPRSDQTSEGFMNQLNFCGHLYMHDVLDRKSVLHQISSLAIAEEESKRLGLCRLFSVVGYKLGGSFPEKAFGVSDDVSDPDPKVLQHCWEKVVMLCNPRLKDETKVTPRLLEELKDLLELRRIGWKVEACEKILEEKKLNAENFEAISREWVHSGILDNKEMSRAGAKMLCSKAQREPENSELCGRLAVSASVEGPMFKGQLIDQCQEEFESADHVKAGHQVLSDSFGPGKNISHKEALASANLAIFKSRLSHMRFMGELYMQEPYCEGQPCMSHKTIISILYRLFDKHGTSKHFSDDVECLAMVLSTVGQKLEEHVKLLAKESSDDEGTSLRAFNDIWERVSYIVKNNEKERIVNRRVQSVLEDLEDRREKGWPIKKHTCNFIICERSAHLACSRCEEVWYCCKEHQKADWKAHKKYCGDLKLKRERAIAAQKAVESTIANDGSKSGDSKAEGFADPSLTKIARRRLLELGGPDIANTHDGDDAPSPATPTPVIKKTKPASTAKPGSTERQLEILDAKTELGLACKNTKDFDGARKQFILCKSGYEKLLGKDDEKTLRADFHLISVTCRNNDEMILKLRKLINRMDLKIGHEHITTLNTNVALAERLKESREHSEASKILLETLDVMQRTLGQTHSSTLSLMIKVGLSFESLSDYGSALNYYQKCLEGRRKTHGRTHRQTLEVHLNIATLLHLGFKNYAGADEHYEIVLTGYEKLHGKQHKDTMKCVMNYMMSCKEGGNRERLEKIKKDYPFFYEKNRK
ncbi:hypothetical protein TrST_g6100 [Triparma strigata]|uniref:MYND-type domain-containing protein n=1 Tax=Triparma strigata TaxID=1606541 RepID=A0A9W7F5W2_9STRA|nr:hypothetical protein TrST_g6100 [Triparma strigata]